MPTERKRRANAQNGKATQFRAGDEQVKIATAGGKASGEARRRLRTFRELDMAKTTEEERNKMMEALKQKAMRGNLKAFEIYRDTVGLKPRDSVEVYAEISNPYANLTEAELKKLAQDG